jgi:hypothetical protein
MTLAGLRSRCSTPRRCAAAKARARQRALELRQVLPAHQLADEVGAASHLAHAVDGDDVGVREAGDGPRLDEELVAHAGLELAAGGHELHRHLAVEHGVVGEEDFAHGAVAERLQEAVFVDRGGGRPVVAGGGGRRVPGLAPGHRRLAADHGRAFGHVTAAACGAA